jgi:hypothetical protein
MWLKEWIVIYGIKFYPLKMNTKGSSLNKLFLLRYVKARAMSKFLLLYVKDFIDSGLQHELIGHLEKRSGEDQGSLTSLEP